MENMAQSTLPISSSITTITNNTVDNKHKGGRPSNVTLQSAKSIESIDIAIKEANINIVTVLKIIYNAALGNKNAMGKYKYNNGNGTEIPLKPDIDACKWLVEQMFGKATARELGTKDMTALIKKFSQHTRSVLPSKQSVTNKELSTVSVTKDGIVN
jgi:hypothetical protein